MASLTEDALASGINARDFVSQARIGAFRKHGASFASCSRCVASPRSFSLRPALVRAEVLPMRLRLPKCLEYRYKLRSLSSDVLGVMPALEGT